MVHGEIAESDRQRTVHASPVTFRMVPMSSLRSPSIETTKAPIFIWSSEMGVAVGLTAAVRSRRLRLLALTVLGGAGALSGVMAKMVVLNIVA